MNYPTPTKHSQFRKLPPDIIHYIFGFFPLTYLISTISPLCKEFHAYIFDFPPHWHTLKLNHYLKHLPSFLKFYKSHKQSFNFVKRLYFCGIGNDAIVSEIPSYLPSLTQLIWFSPLKVENFTTLTNLTELNIFSLQNVDGIVKLTNLMKLKMEYCRNLQNVDPITKLTKLKKR